MADSVIKISADFGQFVSGAKIAEAEIRKLAEDLKSLGVSYKDAMSGAQMKGDALEKTRGVADELKKLGAEFGNAFSSNEGLKRFQSEIDNLSNSLKTSLRPVGAEKLSAEFARLGERVKSALKMPELESLTNKFSSLGTALKNGTADANTVANGFRKIGEAVKANMNPADVAKFSTEFNKLVAKLQANPADVAKITQEFKELAKGVQSSMNPAELDRFNNKLKEVAANYERAVKPLAKGFETNRGQDAVVRSADAAMRGIANRNGTSVDEVRRQLIALEQEGEKANSIIGRLFSRFKQTDNSGVRAYDDAIRALHRSIVETHGSYEAFLRSMSRRNAIDKEGYNAKIGEVAKLSSAYHVLGGAGSNQRAIQDVHKQLIMLDGDTSKLGVTAGKTGKQFGSIGKEFKAKSLRSDLNNVSEGFGALGYNLAYLTTQFRGMSSAMLGLTTKNAILVLPPLLSGLAQWRKEIAGFDLASLTGGAFARGKFDLTYAQEQVKALGRAYGATKADAQAAFAEIARASRMPANLINPMLDNLKKLQAYMGNGFKIEGAKRTLYELSQAFTITDHGDGLDALRNFLNKLNGLDEETKQQITNLHNLAAATDDYGKKTEYLGQILDIVVGQANKLETDGITPLNDAVMNLKTAFLDLFNGIIDSKPWEILRNFAVDTINFIAGLAKSLPTIWENFVPDASAIADKFSKHIKDSFNNSLLGRAFPNIGNKFSEYVKNSLSDAGKNAAASIDASVGDVAERISKGFNNAVSIGKGEVTPDVAFFGEKQLGQLKNFADASAASIKKLAKEINNVKEEGGNLKLKPLENITKKGGGGGGKSGLDEGERYLQRLREQYDQVSKMNELQRLEYDILNGKVKLNAVQIEQARELAAAIVERKDAEEAAKRAQELAILADEKRLQLQEKIAEYARKLASYYQADSVVDYAEQIAKFEEERNKINRKLNHDERKEIFQAEIAGATPEQIQRIKGYYEELRKLENVRISEDLKAFIEWLEKDTANKQNWNLGIVKAIENVGDWGKEAFADMQKAAENWINGMSDALADFVRTGKADFKSLANSILDDIARMASKQFIGALFESFSPKGSGGGGAGNAIVNFFKSLFGFASGGYTGNGGKYQAAGIVHKGEYVINADSVRRIGLPFLNALNGFSGGGYVSPAIVNRGVAANDTTVQVNIYNNTTDDVVARRNGTTGALDVIINRSVDAVAASIASGGTVASAMQGTYGLNRGVGLARIGR